VAPGPFSALPCGMPYRIDICGSPPDALEKLIQWGALDIEPVAGGIAAILPDGVTPETVAAGLSATKFSVSPAIGKDDGSVWLLTPRVSPYSLRLTDSTAFGTGHHPTTALCLREIEEALTINVPDSMLDVGTGSGVLALALLQMGVPRADGLDIEADALRIAAENARLNNLADRLRLSLGGPGVVDGLWPLVVANVLAAPLIEMAPVLVRRVGSRGRLILSGISPSLESEVWQAYHRLGMRHIRTESHASWIAVVAQATW
jgi:ribosomal protein L11 methylase PrmA